MASMIIWQAHWIVCVCHHCCMGQLFFLVALEDDAQFAYHLVPNTFYIFSIYLWFKFCVVKIFLSTMYNYKHKTYELDTEHHEDHANFNGNIVDCNLLFALPLHLKTLQIVWNDKNDGNEHGTNIIYFYIFSFIENRSIWLKDLFYLDFNLSIKFCLLDLCWHCHHL